MERLIERVLLDSNVVSYIFNRDTGADYYEERNPGLPAVDILPDD